MTPELRDLLALHLVPGIGPKLLAALLERFGSPGAALKAAVADLEQIPHISAALAQRLNKALHSSDVDAELALMEEHHVRLLAKGTPDYPQALATIAGPPSLLYVRGHLNPQETRAIAIVGSRTCTSYGKKVAHRLAMDLARAGWTIVSGLARGIDGAAHQGALEAQGKTVAVLAGGLARIYPPEHAELAREIAASGALVAESGMRMEPMAGMFPARNRIISGLCRGVVIVEANLHSGALITARHAAEQGREVFAVPGPVDSLASAGALQLLRDGVRLVRDARDILEDLEGIPAAARDRDEPAATAATPPPAGLDATQQAIWDFLSERRNVDDLARQAGKSTAELAGILMTLELRKVVRRLPGNVYERY
jgi:DNA processing protein